MKTLLCGIAKCENHYIREWIEWYKRIGVDKVVLYDNNDVDGERFDEVIADYIKSKFVQVIDFRGKKLCQLEAYNDCYKRFGLRYDWFLFLDVDEYLKIDKEPFARQIKPFLEQPIFDAFNGIKVCWKTMADSGHVRVVNGNYSRDRFTDIAPKGCRDNMFCKTIVRGKKKLQFESSVHFPKGVEGYVCNVLGEPESASNKMDAHHRLWTKAVILHYRYRTIEEYILNKRARGYADHNEEYAKNYLSLDRFFALNVKTPEKEAVAKELLG